MSALVAAVLDAVGAVREERDAEWLSDDDVSDLPEPRDDSSADVSEDTQRFTAEQIAEALDPEVHRRPTIKMAVAPQSNRGGK